MHFTTYMNLNTQDNINCVKYFVHHERRISIVTCLLHYEFLKSHSYTFITGQSCYHIYIRMLSDKIAARRETR